MSAYPHHPTTHPTIVPLRDRSIGALLIDAGRLRPEDADRILRAQRERGLRFGEAAIELGLLTEADIRFALGRQYEHAILPIGDASIDAEVIAAFRPGHFTVEALRQLRTQLLLRWLDTTPDRRSFALIGAEAAVGRSFIAANLAVLFAQLGEKTLLIDADLREPRQHHLFRLPNDLGVATVLTERANLDVARNIVPLPKLTVLTAGVRPPNPQELLSRPAFARMIDAARHEFDVVLIDTPPWDDGADAQIIAARAGASILVTRQDRTSIRSIAAIVTALRECGAHLVGSVVNQL
jgi:receptor protein-tyrosine kinase